MDYELTEREITRGALIDFVVSGVLAYALGVILLVAL